MEWGVSVTPRQHRTPGKDTLPIVQGAGWASGPVWTGAENFSPPGFDPRTFQPIGSRYTDYATRSTFSFTYLTQIFLPAYMLSGLALRNLQFPAVTP